jgi:hypothetical protein
LILAQQFGVTLFMPKEERRNLRKESIPTAAARETSRAEARES